MTEREVTEQTTHVPGVDALDAAASAPIVDYERAGMAILDRLEPVAANQLYGKVIDLTERDAKKMSEFGDIVAAATSSALEMLAIAVGRDGLPSDQEERAILVATSAKRAAVKARDDARKVWSPRDKASERKTSERDAAADAAPNSLGRWTDAALIARAERYTSGDLSPRARVVWVVSPTGEIDQTTRTTPSRLLAGAVLDARDESHIAPRRILTKSTARHAGGTSPAAESVYWRQRSAMVTDVALESALALAGIPMSALTDTDVWHKNGTLAWQAMAEKVDLPRGTVRDRARSAARAARAAMACPHTGTGAACQCSASPVAAQRILLAP